MIKLDIDSKSLYDFLGTEKDLGNCPKKLIYCLKCKTYLRASKLISGVKFSGYLGDKLLFGRVNKCERCSH